MFRNVLRLGAIRGIDIRIDATWLVIAALITWSFWGQFTMIYGQEGPPALAMAVIGALLFFSSVLAHELAHALEAQSRGVTVGGITLFLFGGVTESKFDVRRPVDEFALTIVGPLTSFLLAGVFGVISNLAQVADGFEALAQVTGLLAWINLALGVFNLIPGAPLDGGRILRAAIWKATGDRQRSIRIAADVGRVVGVLLIGLGVLQVLLVAGGLFGGLWLALIGWFLMRGAAAEKTQAELAELLQTVPAGVAVRRTEPVPAGDPVTSLIDRWVDGDDPDVLPVSDGGRLVGVVSVEEARGVAEEERHSRPVGTVMVPVEDLPTMEVERPASEALDGLMDRGYVVATDHGRPVGVIDADRLLAVARRRAPTHERGDRPVRR